MKYEFNFRLGGVTPPDPVIAAGPSYVVEVVNLAIAIFKKDGSKVSQQDLSAFFGDTQDTLTYPKIIYDQYSQRWVVLLLEYNDTQKTSSYLLKVSETSDPTGSWYPTYTLNAMLNGQTTNSGLYADYPGLGFDANAVYITSDQWTSMDPGGSFEYAKIRVLNKSQLYAGQSVSYTDFWGMTDANGQLSYAVKPVQSFGTTGSEYLINNDVYGGNYISLWRIDNPLSSPTLTLQATVSIGSYTPITVGYQEGTSSSIDLDGCFTYDAMYRNGLLYTAFTTGYNWGSGEVSAIRYDVINVSTNTATTDAEYGSDGVYYCYPNILADGYGDITMVFSRMSSSEYPGVFWAYRTPTDATMRPSEVLQDGQGYYDWYNASESRWGDYSGISLDPSTDNQVWFCGEYATGNPDNWGTEIGSFTFAPVEFSNLIGGSNAGGNLLINSTLQVSSMTDVGFEPSSSNSVTTLGSGTEASPSDRFNGTDKDNNWRGVNSSYLLTENFTPTSSQLLQEQANFVGLSPATITAASVDGANISGMKLAFDDPWYMNATSPQGNNYAQAAFPITQTSSPMTGAYNQGTGGAFLNQGVNPQGQWIFPYYSVGFPTGQTITVGGTNHQLYLVNWTASGANIQNPNANQSGVEFTSSNATVTANVKATQLSNDPSAYSDNGQRKFVRTPNGFLHCVYSDGGHIWYEYSTDNGTTWHLGMNWLATGPYGPLDGTAGGKDPSIDYDPQTNNVVIVWQQKSSNGYYTIQYMTFWPDDYVQNTYSINSYGTLYTDGSDAYSSVNANPNIAVNATASGGTEFWVLSLEKYHWYITAGDTVFGGIDVLWGTFSGGNTLDISQDNYGGDLPTHIAGTNYASVNATIYGNKTSAGGYNGSNSGWTFPLAWQQNPGINGTQIKYTQLTLYYDANGVLALHQDPVTQLSQSNTPDNHNPSIIAIPGSNGPTYAICWLLDFTGEGLSTTTRVCYTSGNNTSLNYVGSLPQSCSLNVSDDNSVSYFVWSQGSAPWSDYVVSTSNLGSAIALNSTGDGMQLSNGSGKSNMYEISYLSSGSAPYAISPAIGLGSVGGLQSTAPAHLSDSSRTVAGAPVQAFDSRGVVIGNDSASLQYLFGDITVDGKSVPFVTIPDTFKSRNLSDVNQLLETQPFSLNSNSKVTFGEFSVIADTEAMSTLLGDTGYVSFKAELLNASTDKVLGTIRGWNFGSKDLSKFKQAAYNLNTGGYSGNDLKIRITASTNIEDPIAIPVNDYSTENVAASASAQSVTMQQASLVTTYSLSQNYPNPFNPTTVIEYTIPKESQVTLKIYDVLGQEVETLVNEEQNVGSYEVQFNGSRLASGVYFYRLAAGNHAITKKMLLLK